MDVQIFGLKKSQATRAAERFFKERKIKLHIVDLNDRPIAPGELKRFTDKLRINGVLDVTGKAYVDAGLEADRGRLEALARGLRVFGVSLEILNGANEILHVLKIAVNAGEANVSNLVELA